MLKFNRSKSTDTTRNRCLIVGVFLYCFVFYCIFLLDKESIDFLLQEDGISENFGALFLFLSFIFSFILFFKSKSGNDFFIFKTGKNILFLFLGLVFLFGAGEEISWGQRIFHFDIPDFLEKANLQGEFNIHNLPFFHNVDSSGELRKAHFNMTHLFTLFSLGFCFFLPLLNSLWPFFSRLRQRIAVPLVPMEIGIFFAATYGFSKALLWFVLDVQLHAANLEVRESLWAFLFFMIAIQWIRKIKRKRSPAACNSKR